MEVEEGRAAIWEFNPDGSDARVFASGLRNPVGMDWAPVTGALWTSVNERDMLGDNLVPDYMTSVRDGGFYGWPYYYYGENRDERVPIPENVRLQRPIAPDYALGAHTASLGLHFYRGEALPEHYRGGVFVGQHGSWNRREPAGYKVIFVPFENGAPAGPPGSQFSHPCIALRSIPASPSWYRLCGWGCVAPRCSSAHASALLAASAILDGPNRLAKSSLDEKCLRLIREAFRPIERGV